MSTQQQVKVHQGKYGYYVCSYEEYLFLKDAHKLFYRAIVDRRRWQRWARKDPDNRLRRVKDVHDAEAKITNWKEIPIPEPRCFHLDEHDMRTRSKKYISIKESSSIDGYQYDHLLEQYRIARKPYRSKQECEEAAESLHYAGYVKIIERLKEFYNK